MPYRTSPTASRQACAADESFRSTIILWTGLFALALIVVFGGLTMMLSGLPHSAMIDSVSWI